MCIRDSDTGAEQYFANRTGRPVGNVHPKQRRIRPVATDHGWVAGRTYGSPACREKQRYEAIRATVDGIVERLEMRAVDHGYEHAGKFAIGCADAPADREYPFIVAAARFRRTKHQLTIGAPNVRNEVVAV